MPPGPRRAWCSPQSHVCGQRAQPRAQEFPVFSCVRTDAPSMARVQVPGQSGSPGGCVHGALSGEPQGVWAITVQATVHEPACLSPPLSTTPTRMHPQGEVQVRELIGLLGPWTPARTGRRLGVAWLTSHLPGLLVASAWFWVEASPLNPAAIVEAVWPRRGQPCGSPLPGMEWPWSVPYWLWDSPLGTVNRDTDHRADILGLCPAPKDGPTAPRFPRGQRSW